MFNEVNGQRRHQILRLLIEHGPMSFAGIKLCIYPTITRRSLFKSLKILRDRNFIEVRRTPSTGDKALFYLLKQKPESIKRVCDLLQIAPDTIRPPYFRRAELLHSDSCAIWKEYLKRTFPESLVLRDHEFFGSVAINKLLMNSGNERDLLPDILMIFPRKTHSQPLTIAVEIERNAKSVARLVRRLIKVATESRVDGTIYFCEGNVDFYWMRAVYQSKVLKRAQRINHFGNNFVIFTNSIFQAFDTPPQMFNAALENISLSRWIDVLLNSENGDRRDSKFVEVTPATHLSART